jgi:hypothetical protein
VTVSLACLVAHVFDEVAGLHEHARRAAGRVQHQAVVWLDDVDDHAHQRRRREELAAFLCAAHGELVEEVFVDAAEHVAGGGLDGGAVEDLDQLGQQVGLEGRVAARQRALEHFVLGLDHVHGAVDHLAHVRALRQAGDAVEARRFGQVDGGLALEAEPYQRLTLGGRHLRRDVSLDLGQVGLETVVRVAQKDQAEHRHRVFGGGELGVGAQLVGGLPEFVFELLHVHSIVLVVLSVPAVAPSSAPPARTHSSTSDSWNFHSRPILWAGRPLRSRQR